MKFNPYSAVLIMVFIITVSVSNYKIKRNKKTYEKTNNDSIVRANHGFRTFGKM